LEGRQLFQQYFFFSIYVGLKHGFYFLFPYVKSKRGKEMMKQKISKNHDGVMAEKCRRALEKSFGAGIPLPKCMDKKVNMHEAKSFLGRKNVQK
jgi:hypothetical protein